MPMNYDREFLYKQQVMFAGQDVTQLRFSMHLRVILLRLETNKQFFVNDSSNCEVNF